MHDTEENVHKGHRARMRQKLTKHGSEIFDTYELLEMLLYHVIPYKDTNPIAKRLLRRFNDLDGVISAGEEELASVPEIGVRSAKLISLVNSISELLSYEMQMPERVGFNSYTAVGEYFVRYFREHPTERVAAMIFDNAMRLLASFGFDAKLDSAAIKPKLFLNPVIRAGAAVIVTASRTLYPGVPLTDSERASVKMINNAMQDITVLHAEHYLVTDDRYFPAMHGIVPRSFVQTPEVDGFIDSLPKYEEVSEP